MTDINTVLVFKSIDVKNNHNKPGDFTTKINPEIILDSNKQHYIALDRISMYASWHNIRSEYNNNKLKVTKNGGTNWIEITFPSGVYDYEDINKFIHEKIGVLDPSKPEKYGINISFDLTTYKVFIKLENNYWVDFRSASSGNFGFLLGFGNDKIIKTNTYSPNFPNISNTIDNLYLRCSLVSDSIISGQTSSVIYSFSTSTKSRALPFEITVKNYLWNIINTSIISEVRLLITDDLDRIVDLNDIDISITLVIKSV